MPRSPRITRTSRITRTPRTTRKRKFPNKKTRVCQAWHTLILYSGKQPFNDFYPSQGGLASCVSSLVALN